jgi:hypothetical protein
MVICSSSDRLNARSDWSTMWIRSAACSRASGTAGTLRPHSTRWAPAGRRRISSATRWWPEEPGGTSWRSSRMRQVSIGEQVRRASSTASTGPMAGGSTPNARQTASAKRRASSSPGSQVTHDSMPRGSAACNRVACANAVDLPNPGPATTVVTGTSHRSVSRWTSAARKSSPEIARGGPSSRRATGGRTGSVAWNGRMNDLASHAFAYRHEAAGECRAQGSCRVPY